MQARPLLNTASLWLQTSFRKQARPLLSTASLSLAALWRFGAVPLLEALTLLDALALLEALTLWRFVVLRRLGALRLFDASWRSGNTAAMNTGDGACVSELAALRLCGFAASAIHGGGNAAAMNAGGGAWVAELAARRLCGFAACAFHGGFAALRLCGLSVPWRLCGFAALTLFRVRACTRTRVQWENPSQEFSGTNLPHLPPKKTANLQQSSTSSIPLICSTRHRKYIFEAGSQTEAIHEIEGQVIRRSRRWASALESTAICNNRFKTHKELGTQEQPLVAEHRGGTHCVRNDPSRTRRTHEVPFIAGRNHFTRKNTRFRAPASSPKQSPTLHWVYCYVM